MLDTHDTNLQVVTHEVILGELIAPLPRVSVQAFCETADVASVLNDAISDRRMDKAHVKVHMGGAYAAVEAYRSAPTPNVIILETGADRDQLLANLDALSEFCDHGTKVVVIGNVNDIGLYRLLKEKGVSEYLVTPFNVIDFIRALSGLFNATSTEPLGRMIAVVGAKGGIGASTVAHNLAWSIAASQEIVTVLADMDVAFGTAGLNFNQDPPQGIADAVFAPDRLDANLLDRLLSKCSEKLSMLAAPAMLDQVCDFKETAFDGIFDILRSTVPCIVADVPHNWTSWARRALISAEEIVIVATPDLANLRNTKNLIDTLRTARPHDTKPRLVMNLVGMPKRPEISVADFAKSLDLEPTITLAFDPKLFGTAANNGQMLAEIDGGAKVAESFNHLARIVTGRSELKKQKRSIFEPLVARLSRKKAS
ncbi:MAG: AAA family ATPase [Hyphomicrobiales bacterium]|nr:AAA family ATPase [Hyphomicrobiales bacterium]MDE2114380.1 AAA family ATPase [Hyphomicrobiales bacterium]